MCGTAILGEIVSPPVGPFRHSLYISMRAFLFYMGKEAMTVSHISYEVTKTVRVKDDSITIFSRKFRIPLQKKQKQFDPFKSAIIILAFTSHTLLVNLIVSHTTGCKVRTVKPA